MLCSLRDMYTLITNTPITNKQQLKVHHYACRCSAPVPFGKSFFESDEHILILKCLPVWCLEEVSPYFSGGHWSLLSFPCLCVRYLEKGLILGGKLYAYGLCVPCDSD